MVSLVGQILEKTYSSYHRSLKALEATAVAGVSQQTASASDASAHELIAEANAKARRYQCESKLIEEMYSRHMYVFDRMHQLTTTVVDQWKRSGTSPSSELEQLTVFLRQNTPVEASGGDGDDDNQSSRGDLEHHLTMIPRLAEVLEVRSPGRCEMWNGSRHC